MLATVPLFGLMVTGDAGQAKAYAKAWGKAIGWLVIAALLVFAVAFVTG